MFKILRDRNKEEPKNRIMNNIKNLPIYIIGNIIDYMPGPTSTILYRTIMVNDIRLHYKRLDHYRDRIGNDRFYHMFEVIDSMHVIYEKNVFLHDVNQIPDLKRQHVTTYEIRIESVTPNIKLGNIYLCDLIFVRQAIRGRSFHYRGATYRAEESTLPLIKKTNKQVKYPVLDITNDLSTDD